MAPSDSSEITAAMRTLGDKGLWPQNVKQLYTLMLSRCSSASNHGLPILTWMARACPVKVKAGAAMTNRELADWNDTTKTPNGRAALQKADETLYTVMSLMTTPDSEGGRAMYLGVDTGDINIGEGFKLLCQKIGAVGLNSPVMGAPWSGLASLPGPRLSHPDSPVV